MLLPWLAAGFFSWLLVLTVLVGGFLAALPFTVTVGGQTVAPASPAWSYARPAITSITTALGSGFTPLTCVR